MYIGTTVVRSEAGTNIQIYRQADSAQEILIWSDVADVAKGREALAGPENRSAMTRPSSGLPKYK
jgi:hypothetical protein